jgi:hypothetical protein
MDATCLLECVKVLAAAFPNRCKDFMFFVCLLRGFLVVLGF